MSETFFLGLPYLEAAQAQKHVTVNEALRRLDAAVHLSVESRMLAAPPATPDEGERYIVAASASGAWAGHEDDLAAWIDGAWMFVAPQMGWRAFDAAADAFVFYNGSGWIAEPAGSGATSAHGAATHFHVLEGDHTISAGASNDTGFVIPERAIVLGVTGRVLEEITGPASWTLGVAADAGRYGTGIGTGAGSTVIGPSGPVTYWSEAALRLTGTGGDFTGGTVRLAIHYVALTAPDA
tara:strand:- start:203510 stop:204223 length:714 start_codon:yes stop_codon:yes gene_type:complete